MDGAISKCPLDAREPLLRALCIENECCGQPGNHCCERNYLSVYQINFRELTKNLNGSSLSLSGGDKRVDEYDQDRITRDRSIGLLLKGKDLSQRRE